MRKFIFTALFLYLSSVISAQERIDNSGMPSFKTVHKTAKTGGTSIYGKTSVSGWYNALDIAAQDSMIGDSLLVGVDFMFHDSLARMISANNVTGHNSWISVGSVLDPKDRLIGLTSHPEIQLNPYSDYTLDSIRFSYLYARNVDSVSNGTSITPVVDTLFIAYFKESQVHKYALDGSGNKYALTDWRGNDVLLPKNYAKLDTVLLTGHDSTSVFNENGGWENRFDTKTMSLKVVPGIAVNVNNGSNTDNLIAYSLTFKSAVPAVSGTDTAIMLYQQNPASLPIGSRRTNYFGFRYAAPQNAGSRQNQQFFNTSMLCPWWAAYQSSNGWYGYVPGNAFTKEYIIDADFYLTAEIKSGVIEPHRVFSISRLYPDPAIAHGTAFLDLMLLQPADISIEAMDLTGKHVKTFMKNSLNADEQHIRLDLSGMAPGMYFINLSTGGSATTKKLVVTE